MQLMQEFKAHCMCIMIGSMTLCSNAAADSIEILVDAALDQSSLQIATEVALSVASSAGTDHSVGLVVFDKVFQRSTERVDADGDQQQRISEVLSNLTPSEYSNIAVGIEKGISELTPDGGVLVVLGSTDILLADSEAVSKYRDWLDLVLLPDAASKSISIILASPESAQSNALESIILAFPDNRVISYTDAPDLIDQLSALLPFKIISNTQIAQAATDEVNASELSIPDQAVAVATLAVTTLPVSELPATTLPVSELPATPSPVNSDVDVQSNQQSGASLNDYILLALVTLALIIGVALYLLLKRRRNNNSKRLGDTVETDVQPMQSRYLAPKQGLAAVLTTRVDEEDFVPSAAREQLIASQSTPDSSAFDESIATASNSVEDNDRFGLDITAPQEIIGSDVSAQALDPDATVQRKAISPEELLASSKKARVDELEELRTLTQQKNLTKV